MQNNLLLNDTSHQSCPSKITCLSYLPYSDGQSQPIIHPRGMSNQPEPFFVTIAPPQSALPISNLLFTEGKTSHVFTMTRLWHRHRALLTILMFAGVFFCLYESTSVLSFRRDPPLTMLSNASAGGIHSVDLGWYPPSSNAVNDLSGVLKGEGVYGFIFDTSVTSDEEYGTYNWCNMPHARRREYQRPGSEYELKYVEVVSETYAHRKNPIIDTCRSKDIINVLHTPPTPSQ